MLHTPYMTVSEIFTAKEQFYQYINMSSKYEKQQEVLGPAQSTNQD